MPESKTATKATPKKPDGAKSVTKRTLRDGTVITRIDY